MSRVSYGAWSANTGATRNQVARIRATRGGAVKRGGENIIIVHEANKQTPEFQEAHELLSQADFVYFLGFGFNKNNVGRLRIDTLLRNVSTGGTAFGLPLQERKYIQSLHMAGCTTWIKGLNSPMSFYDLECYNFLEKQVVFE